MNISASVPVKLSEKAFLTRILLICGILSSLYYAGINVYVAMEYKGYSSAAQTVSELSAIGAPTRMLWVWLCFPYTLLVIAFAWGVWRSAGQNYFLRIAGKVMVAYGVLGVFWPFAPMHLRETLATGGGTFSDTMHITLGVITEVLFLLALGFASAALNKQFRFYSIVTFIVLLVFGILTFLDAPDVSANKPTPFIGIWERINIGLFLLWISALAIVLLEKNRKLQPGT